MSWETWVQSQVESHQRLKKWYLMPPYLTLSIIRYASRVKWSNPGKGVAPSPKPWCSSYRKGSLRVTLDYGRQLYLLIYIYIWKMIRKTVLQRYFSSVLSSDHWRTLYPLDQHIYIYIYIYIYIWKMIRRTTVQRYVSSVLSSGKV